jgi:hypothetical protein
MMLRESLTATGPLSERTPVLPMAALLTAVLAVGLVYVAVVPIPAWFPFAHVLLPAGVALMLALGLLAMMPARWLFSEAFLLRHAFNQMHGAGSGRYSTALATVIATHDKASRIRRIAPATQPDIRALLNGTADRFDQIARSLFYQPQELPRIQAVLSRAELVVEAIETHGDLRARAGGAGKDVEVSRARLRSSLAALHDVLDDVDARAVASLLDKVDIASSTAETLLRR